MANLPTRIAFAVASQIDSRVILDRAGAERLLGRGDALYQAGDEMNPRRVQGALVSDDEIEAVCGFWRLQGDSQHTAADEAELQEARLKVEEVARDIADGNFEANPGFHCRFCAYKNLCPATETRIFRPAATKKTVRSK